MIKIGNIADIHLQGGFESKEAKALLRAGEIFREKNVDLVIVGGDIFEDVSTEEQRLVFKQFLQDFHGGIPILILRGNHDKPRELYLYENKVNAVHVCEKPEVLDFDLSGEAIKILTLPHFSAGALALQSGSVDQLGEKGTNAFMDLLDSYYQIIQKADCPCFVAFHGTISGAKLDNEKIPRQNGIHLPLPLLESFGCPVVGGHYHKLQNVGGKVWYPGSITRQTWGEHRDDKGILIWQCNDDKIGMSWDTEPEFISLNPEPMISISATWDGSKFIGETGEEIKLESISDVKSKLRFRFTVDKELTHTVPKNLKELLAAIDPSAKIEKTTNTKMAVRNSEIATTNDIEESLRIYFQGKGMSESDIEAHLAERRLILESAEINQEVAS